MSRFVFFRLILFYGILSLHHPACAATEAAGAPSLSAGDRVSLARDFVTRLKGKLQVGNVPALSPVLSARIAEGTTVQFRPRLGQVRLDYDIYAIKGRDDFFLSLTDFIDTLNLPITLDTDKGTAQGWFLREDWHFGLDMAQRRVQARGQDFPLKPQDYQAVDGDIFVAGAVLGVWFDMAFSYDVSQQYIDIKSAYPLPLLAQMKRHEGRAGHKDIRQIAQLPRQKPNYKWAHLTTADVALRTNYSRDGDDGKANTLNRSDVMLSGDFLKHDAHVFINADDRDGLNAVTGSLSRSSDQAELLGPLKARSYAMGDITTVAMPLSGGTGQELGIRVSNNPLTGISFQKTSITGNALPGWDVELYRGNARIDLVTADDTGRYEFLDVQLFAGDNDFDVYFYGQQGEVRREHVNIPLNEAALASQAGTYDVSLSLNQRMTYQRLRSEDEDAGTPRLSGQYNFSLGNALAYAGVHMLEQGGKQKAYAGSGITGIVDGYVLDANMAADEKGEVGGRLGVRKNIYDWNLALTTELASDEFSPDSSAMSQTLGVFGSAQKSYTPFWGLSGNMILSGNYREYADGSTAQTASWGLGQGFNRLSLSNSLLYDQVDPAHGAVSERLMDSLSARAFLSSQVSVRAGVDYMIKPDNRLDRYLVSINYRPAHNLTIDAEAEHQPDTRYSQGELRANYIHDKFRLSPFVRYDSDRDLTAGLSLTTSFLDTPYGHVPFVTSERLSGRGYVSARVFLDVNGNYIFDEGDEPIEGTVVESIQSRERQETRADGYALLRRLTTNLPTDIHVDDTSLPDPFMVAVDRGRSILPRAGEIYNMNFPVQFSGEVDGTVAALDKSGHKAPVKFVSVKLMPLDASRNETVVAKAAPDGFFLLSQVPPGKYYLTVDEKEAQALKVARPMPRLLTFTHEGTMLYAQDIVMRQGHHDIDFGIMSPEFFPGTNTAEPEYFISFSQGKKSGLLESLYRLRMKGQREQAVSGLPVLEGVDGVSYYRVGKDGLTAAYQRCEIMSARNLPCRVSVLPAGGAPADKTEKVKAPAKQAAL